MLRCAWILPLVVLLAAACSEPRQRMGVNLQPVRVPDWTRTGIHPDFPEDRYIVTYGISRLPRDAERQAVERLEAEVCSWPLAEHRHLFRGTDFANIVTGTTAWLPLERLGTAVQTDYAASGYQHFAVRAIQFDELRLRARAMLPQIRDELANADQPPGGVGDLKTRIELWGERFLLAARVVMLQLIVDGSLDQAAFTEAEEAAVQIWSLPGIMRATLGGDRGVTRLSGGMEEPIQIIARFRTRAPGGVPLTWGPAPGFRGSVSGDSAFDATGRAQARVHHLQPTGDEFGYVQAAIDVDRLLGQRTGIELQPWLWTITLPARTNSELMLELVERVNGDADVEPVLVPEMRTWCRSRAITLRSAQSGFSDAPYRLTLRGSLDVRSWTESGVPLAHATGRIELVDASTGQVLFRLFPGVKKEGRRGNTEAAMILAARQDAIADVVSEIGARLLAVIPAQGDEFGVSRD